MRRWLLLIVAATVVLFVVTRVDDESAAPGIRDEPVASVETRTRAPSSWPALPNVAELDGDDAEPVAVEVDFGATLIIRVIDEAGRPIADANVRVASQDYRTGADGVVIAQTGQVWDGGVPVSVTAAGFAGRHESVNLRDERPVTIERTVVLASGAEISGTVVDATGARVAGACVVLAAENTSDTACTDEQGVWRFDDRGKATYEARAHSTFAVGDTAETVVHDGVHATVGVVVRVTSGAEIAIDVVDATGKPAGGVTVIASRTGEATGGGTDHVVETTDDAGQFVARVLPAGTYTVKVGTDTHGAADQVVTLVSGQHARLRFVVVGSTIEGIVVDARGQPVENATIVARSEVPGGYTVAYSDARGRFATGGLPPGRYRVTAQRWNSYDEGPAVEVETGARGARVVVLDEPRENS